MRGATARNQSLVQKWSTVNSTLNKFKIAILALQETHLDQPAVDTLHSKFGKKMEILFSPTPGAPRESAGVAFVINKSLIAPRELSCKEIVPGKALLLKLKWLESEETSILNVYAPTDRSAHPLFWNSLTEAFTHEPSPSLDFMLGDFNLTEELIN
jgi:exonuclease III